MAPVNGDDDSRARGRLDELERTRRLLEEAGAALPGKLERERVLLADR